MANLLINTTVGGNAVITTSNIGSYALTSIPATISPTNINIGNAIYFGGGNNYLNWDGARINSNVGIQSTSDMRAPIFYDSNDTSYYVDPAGVSRINRLQVIGDWSGSNPNEGAINIRGNYPSMTFRNIVSGNMWLRHMDGDGHIQHYFAPSGVDANNWGIKHTMFTNGNFYSLGTHTASQFNGSGAGLTGTASSLTAGSAGNVQGYSAYDLVVEARGMHSGSDFPNGTLVRTDINANGWAGNSFVMEVSGKSYGSGTPFKLAMEGYLYADSIINVSAMSYGSYFPGPVKVMRLDGILAFWWPRGSYWNSFEVHVRVADGESWNRVTSIGDSVDPAAADKKISITPTQVIHTGNIGSQSVSYATTAGSLSSMNISQFTNNSGYLTGITSGQVTSALGYTPYNSSNPSGYITSSALSSYLPLSGGTISGNLTINGTWQTNISTTGGWSKLSFTASNAWGDGITYGVLGASGGNEPGVMIYNPHIVWDGSKAALRIGRSGGVSSGAYYEIGTGASDNFFIAKNGANGSPQFNINTSGNATFSGTISASNLSGTNTGDQTNISGNSATTSQRDFSGDISTSGQGRFAGWYTGNAQTGLAAEIGTSGGQVYIIAYNRQSSAYGTINLSSSGANLQINGSTINATSGTLQQGGNAVIHAGNIVSQSVSYATTAGTANSVAWTNVSGRPTNVSSFTNDTGYYVNGTANTVNAFQVGYSTTNYDFTLGPRGSINSMSIKLWDNYFNNSGLGVDYGSLLDIYGRGGHVHSQFYMDASGGLFYRMSPYAGGWSSWASIWTSSSLTNLNQLTNGPGYITGINSGNVTAALGFTPYNATNPNGYITSSASISGNAATATNVAWTGVTGKPAGWLDTDALVQNMEPSASAFPSGFYQSYLGAGNPTGTWFNYINVRHSNMGNGHGFQLGMSYYDTNLWFRSYQGNLNPSFSAWSYAISSLNIGSQSVSYATTAGSAGSATTAGTATIASQLNKYGDIYGQDWNGYYVQDKLIAAAVYGHSGANRPNLTYDYGCMLSYGEATGPRMQMYFPENSPNLGTIFRKATYRTGWNGNWSTWKTFVEQEGNLCTIVGGNGTGLEVHGNVGYNQDPLTYFLLRGQADTSWKALKVRLTGDAGGQDIEFRRIAENGTDSRMWYVPRGVNTVNFDYPIVQPSDSRLKDNITPISTPVDKIKSLRGVEFDWNSGEQVGTHDVGLIAQDVEAVLPEAVTTQEDGYKNLAYTKVIPLLVEAMKEQQTMIEALRTEIELLKNK